MGYNTGQITIYIRTDNHLDERTWRDREAEESLKREINFLIDSDQDYRRIADFATGGSL